MAVTPFGPEIIRDMSSIVKRFAFRLRCNEWQSLDDPMTLA